MKNLKGEHQMKKIIQLFKEKITLRLLSMILGIILIIGGAAVVLILQQMHHQEVTNATLLGETALESVNNALNTWISDQIDLISMISTDENVITACLDPQDAIKRENALSYVNRFYSSYSYYENIPIAAKFGEDETFQISVEENPVDIVSGAFFVDTVGEQHTGKKGVTKIISQLHFQELRIILAWFTRVFCEETRFLSFPNLSYSEDEIVGAALIAPQMDYFTDIFVQDQENWQNRVYDIL